MILAKLLCHRARRRIGLPQPWRPQLGSARRPTDHPSLRRQRRGDGEKKYPRCHETLHFLSRKKILLDTDPAHERLIIETAQALKDGLSVRAQIHLQRIVGAYVGSAHGAGQFYSRAVTEARDATAKLANDSRDEDLTVTASMGSDDFVVCWLDLLNKRLWLWSTLTRSVTSLAPNHSVE